MEVKPGYKKTEVGVIPEDWDTRPCSALSGLITVGIVIRPAQYYAKQGVPALRSANIREEGIDDADMVFISEKANALLSKSQVWTGDVLIVRTGYPGTSAVVPPSFAGSNCVDILITRPSKAVSSIFLSAWINSSFGKSQVLRKQGGLAQQHFNVGDLRNLVVALPPTKAEQDAIGGALSDVDALIGALDRLVAKKRDLKQAAMQQLLTGQTRLPGFSREWEVKRLGDCLIARPDYGINAPAVPFSDRLPSYLRISDISEYGRFSPGPRVSVNAKNSGQFFLGEGDIVFARTGASVGKSYLYNKRDGQLVFAGFLIRVRPNPQILVSAFLAGYATTKIYWNWVRLMSMRSGQPGINGKEYAQLPMVLPSISEQTAIATVLSDMDAEIEALEQRLAKTGALKQGMMQELLTGRTRLV
jgi:type I restriction enzyme, S subunit